MKQRVPKDIHDKKKDADIKRMLVNRNDLLSRPEFWAIHMFLITKMRAAASEKARTEAAFGKPEKAKEEAHRYC